MSRNVLALFLLFFTPHIFSDEVFVDNDPNNDDNSVRLIGPAPNQTPNSLRTRLMFEMSLVKSTIKKLDFESTTPAELLPGAAYPVTFYNEVTGETLAATVTGHADDSVRIEDRRGLNNPQDGTYPNSGYRLLEVNMPSENPAFTFTFSEPQVAFGYFATDASRERGFGDHCGEHVLVLDGTREAAMKIACTNSSDDDVGYDDEGEVMFAGVISETPFTTVTIYHNGTEGNRDFTGFDDFIVASEALDAQCRPSDPSADLNVVTAFRGGGTGSEDWVRQVVTDEDGLAHIVGFIEGPRVTIDDESNEYFPTGNTRLGIVDYYLLTVEPSGVFSEFLHGGGSIGASSSYNQFYGVSKDEEGNIYLAGHYVGTHTFQGLTVPPPNDADSVVFKLSPDGDQSWAKTGRGPYSTQSYKAVADSEGNVIVVGMFGHFNFGGSIQWDGQPAVSSSGGSDIYIVKLDDSGDALWIRTAGGVHRSSNGNDHPLDVIVDELDNIYVSGYVSLDARFDSFTTTRYGQRDAFLAKYDPDGNIEWAFSMGSSGHDNASNLQLTDEGHVLLGGNVAGGQLQVQGMTFTGTGGYSSYLAEFNDEGEIIDAVVISGSGDVHFGGFDRYDNGDLVFAGSFSNSMTVGDVTLDSAGDLDLVTAVFDSEFEPIWAQRAGGTDQEVAQGIGVTVGGDAIIAGRFTGTANLGVDPLVSAGLTDIFVVRAEIERLDATSCNPELEQLRAQLALLEAELAATEAENIALQEDLDECLSSAESLLDDLEACEADNLVLIADVELLTAENATLETDNADLGQQLADANDVITTLNAQIVVLEQTVADLESTRDDLIAEIDALIADVDLLNAEIDGLETEVDALEQTIADLDAQIEALNGEIAVQNATIEQLNQHLEDYLSENITDELLDQLFAITEAAIAEAVAAGVDEKTIEKAEKELQKAYDERDKKSKKSSKNSKTNEKVLGHLEKAIEQLSK